MKEYILCLFLSVNTLCAQVLISGTILDNETKSPLLYAHVILLNENLGK